MNAKQKLLLEVEQAPDFLIEETLNFLLFTKSRQNAKPPSNPEPNPKNNTQPLWQLADEIINQMPSAAGEKLPSDGAINHDHYLYGTPKEHEC